MSRKPQKCSSKTALKSIAGDFASRSKAKAKPQKRDSASSPTRTIPIGEGTSTDVSHYTPHHVSNNSRRYGRALRSVVGTADESFVKRTMVLNVCYFFQMVLSAYFTVIWVHRTYRHSVLEWERFVEIGLCGFFVFVYILNLMKGGFCQGTAWSTGALIDVLTVVPVFARPTHVGAPWISSVYFRVSRALIAYERIEKTGVLTDISEMTRRIFVMFLRCLFLWS